MSGALDEEKKALRRALRDSRERAAAAAPGAGAALAARFLDAFSLPEGAIVSGFWPMGSEIDLRPLLEALSARGHEICLPVMAAKASPLAFRRWRPGDELVPGGFGTEIPAPEQPELEPRVLLVPLLGFDRDGYRLGYGGGFYDRTLEALRKTGPRLAVGVAYAAQELARAPRDRYDQRLDAIVTERETILIDRTGKQ